MLHCTAISVVAQSHWTLLGELMAVAIAVADAAAAMFGNEIELRLARDKLNKLIVASSDFLTRPATNVILRGDRPAMCFPLGEHCKLPIARRDLTMFANISGSNFVQVESLVKIYIIFLLNLTVIELVLLLLQYLI